MDKINVVFSFTDEGAAKNFLATQRRDGWAGELTREPESLGACEECETATVDTAFKGADGRSVCDDCRDGEPELDTDAQGYLDKRKRKGEKILRVAWGKRNELHEDDRLSAATDAISNVLTAMYGPAGLCLPPTGIFDNVSDVIADAQGVETWRVELDELRMKQAKELLHHALGSYEGDAEDYTVEEG